MASLNWQSIPREQMNPKVARQAFHTAQMTIARIELSQGVTVPEHQHVNEQVSLVESGKLKFVLAGVERIVGPGDIVEIAPNVPHWVEAIEDSVAMDLFTPRREDWLRGDDAYLRK